MSDHPPGHPDAVASGCTCPVLDNAHGKGCGYLTDDGQPVYIVNGTCPQHDAQDFFPDDQVFVRDLSEPAYGAAARLKEKIA